jgi:hypothetical protein
MIGEGAVTPPSIRKDKKANLKQTLKLPKNFAKNKKTPVQRGGIERTGRDRGQGMTLAYPSDLVADL